MMHLPYQQQTSKANRHADNHQERIVDIHNVSWDARDTIDEKLSWLNQECNEK